MGTKGGRRREKVVSQGEAWKGEERGMKRRGVVKKKGKVARVG